MVSENARDMVWGDLLDAKRLARYYAALSDRYRRRQHILRLILFLSAASGIAAFMDILPEYFELVFGVLMAIVLAIDFVSDNAKKSAILHTISVECSRLGNSWEELWVAIDDVNSTDACVRQRNRHLNDNLLTVTSGAGQADIAEDQKLNRKSAERTYKVLADQYG